MPQRVVAVPLMPQRVVVVFSAQCAFSIFELNVFLKADFPCTRLLGSIYDWLLFFFSAPNHRMCLILVMCRLSNEVSKTTSN